MKEIKDYENEIIKIRRAVHANPELAYAEVKTSELVAAKLRSLGAKVRTGVGGTGVVGLLDNGGVGKAVALRADMDALPIAEDVALPFKSKNEGVMHACGHDTHVAMLLGAAMLISRHKEDLEGPVKFLFQPAEEEGGRGGALPMIEDGALENPKVNHVFGLHITGEEPSGTFALREGAALAAPDIFTIRILGKSGHGSRPDETIDPIFVSSQVIIALQGISGRMVNPVQPFVISIGSMHSGTKHNIIPDEAVLEGTMRTLDEKIRARGLREIKRVVTGVCRAYGARCEISFKQNTYPITYNDPATTRRVAQILKGISSRVVESDPILGAEDFSRFLEKAPGTFYFLGTKNKSKGCVYPNHSSKFKVDEGVLKLGSVSLALLALEFAGSS
jgi:carboxypeptidase Ss1